MEFDIQVKLAIYSAFAETGKAAHLGQIAADLRAPLSQVRDAYARLAGSRLLVLEPNGHDIRMAPPFSGVPTQHRVRSSGVDYFANCAWDALGIPAALHRPAEVDSRCEQSLQPLHLEVGAAGPDATSWLFHCAVPAAKWWQDIVFT